MSRSPRKHRPASSRTTTPSRTKAGTQSIAAQTFIVLAALLGAGWFLLAEHEIAGKWGFSLDDSWIYATFARNLATGHGYSFNPGESIGGATGPLYVFILAALYLIFHDPVLPAKVLGMLCLSASSLLVYRAARNLDQTDEVKPILAGLLVALSPTLLWGAQSGMEIPVYLLLACLGIYCYTLERWTLVAVCWSAGVWLRPDGIFLALLSIVARPKVTLRNTIGPVAAAGSIFGAYLLFNYVVGGAPLPSSVGVKSSLGGDFIGRELSMGTQWLWLWGISLRPESPGHHFALLIPAMVAGAITFGRRLPAFVAYAFGFPFLFGALGPSGGQHARYIAYVVPFGILLGCGGIGALAGRALGRRYLRAYIVLGLLCIGWQVYVGRKVGIAHGWNVQNINGMQRFMAERIRKVASPGDTIAVNDVGAMGYFSNCYIVDLVGLVSPKRSFPENLKLYHPRFLAIFPDWYRDFAARDPQIDNVVFYGADSTWKYSPVVGVGLHKNTISSRDVMVLFERMRPSDSGSADVPIYWH